MHTKTADVSVKAGPADGLAEGEFIAYPSTFTRTPDAYGDVVAPGAFLDTIAEWEKSGNVMPILYGHNFSDPDYNIGGALEMSEDAHGWLVKGSLDMDKPKAKQVYDLLKAKRISQLSFAFDVLDEGAVEIDGMKANELRKLKVYEASFVPIGANQETSVVEVKGLDEAVRVARDVASKAGRVISAKNEESLLTALDGLKKSSAQIEEVLGQLAEEQPAKAASAAPAPEPEIDSVKSQPERDPALKLAELQIAIASL